MGLFEKVQQAGMSCAMLYGWEPLRDIARPGAMRFSHYEHSYAEDSVDTLLTDEALRLIDTHHPDLVFLYMVDTDEKGGHDNGWMSEEYLRRIYIAIDNVRRAVEHCGDEYAIVLMADHGGHDRSHGTTCPEDMTIPFFFRAPEFEAERVVEGLSLLDIAPTVVRLLGLEPDAEWEGHPVV